jgi:hypothetical protein
MLQVRWFVVCLSVLTCAVTGEQTRISIRAEPKPDQTIHVTATQEFSFRLDAGTTASEPAAAQIVTESVLGYTQANGRFDDQGRMESQLTIERMDVKQSFNGNPKAPANTAQLLGHSITAVFDRGGKLVDLKVPKELDQVSGVLKQMVASAYGALNFLPAAAMAVGETETTPSSIPLRMPGNAKPVPYQTRTVTKLRALDKNGSDRVARFEQSIESANDKDALKVHGTGTIDLNLDGGFVAASATEWKFSGGSAAAAPSGTVSGTMRVTVAAHE